MKNMLIAQSGGPSAVINASLAGAVYASLASEKIDKLLGAAYGPEGLLSRRIIDIGAAIKSSEDIEKLANTPAQALGSSRYKIPEDDSRFAIFEKIKSILEENDVGYFFYNGGNDSMDTVARLSAYLKECGSDICCIGIPKTIDNDLMGTDHTPGYGSAARYIVQSVREAYMDMIVYDRPYVMILEVMGRNAGWLTAASALAKSDAVDAPHLIYLPEKTFDPNDFIEKIGQLLKNGHKHVLVAVSEGIRLADGSYVADTGLTDVFGHTMLGGAGKSLEKLVLSRIEDVKTRSIEFNILQRSAAHLASATDRREAFCCGEKAVEAAINGINGAMITMRRVSDEPYLISYESTDLSCVANAEKIVPNEWISEDGASVTEEFLQYARPLIRGAASGATGELPASYFSFDL